MKFFFLKKSDPVVGLIILVFVMVAFFSHRKDDFQVERKNSLPKVHGKIMFDNILHEFGKVTEGDVIKHTFKFKNEGPGAVKIISTKTSCGCTTAEAALKEYAAGESGEMAVTIDMRGKKGIVVKTITVLMENSKEESAELLRAGSLIEGG